MGQGIGRVGLLLAGLGAMLGGCTQTRDHKGYVVDSVLIDSVQPGVDNRDSVLKTLGRPSFASQFDQEATWYYWSRDTRQLAFNDPVPVRQVLLTVRFAPSGDVAAVAKTGREAIQSVSLYGKRTPVLGSDRGFFAELFGNIGTVGGVGQRAGTADNPEG